MGKKKGSAEKIKKTAQSIGFQHLRPGQEEAVQSLLSGRDTLVIMPTGAGKSAIYHIAAILIPGPTVVISPLLSLQQDQIESIEDKEVAPVPVRSWVLHNQWGKGVVEKYEGDKITVLFSSDAGRRALSLQAVLKNNLLTSV